MSAAGELIPYDQNARLVKCDWSDVQMQSDRMGWSGQSAVNVFGPTLWRLEVETERLTLDQARRWSAWIRRREGKAYTFTAPRLFRVNPRGALGTADGSIGLTVDAPNSRITLTGVGAYQARDGDMISYRTAANGFWAGEVVGDVNASAGSIIIDVKPRPVPKHATTPAVRRVQALAEFELTTDPGPFESYTQRGLSFEAMQVPR